MLAAINTFLQKHLAPHQDQTTIAAEVRCTRVAAAALLVEVMQADDTITPDERRALLDGVGSRFSLTAVESAELIAAAEEQARAATDLFQATSQINRQFSPEQKRWLVEELWRVAYADGVLHLHEEHLVRKVANLIHVSHLDTLAAKHRVETDGRR